jgi:hypothetical protein
VSDKKGLEDFGEVLFPENIEKAQGFVIFFPPATGDKGQQLSEAKGLMNLNYICILYRAPYLAIEGGGLAQPILEIEKWTETKKDFEKLQSLIFQSFPFLRDKLILVGKNLGGSMASMVANSAVKSLVITGSVPILSDFWCRSSHPVAVNLREGISSSIIEMFARRTEEFDLLRNLENLNSVRPC